MPRKQLNIGLTPEQRAQVDEIATALDTTPTEFARSAILMPTCSNTLGACR